MKSLKKVRDTPQDVEVIIHSFETYALGDINHNREKPIAAFILSVCFINSISCFLYPLKRDRNKKPEDFIRDHMNAYHSIGIYDYVRHSLVHNYSSEGRFDIDNKGNQDVPYKEIGDIIYINTNVFISYLETAFDKIKILLRDKDSDEHKHAVEWSMYSPVLVDPSA